MSREIQICPHRSFMEYDFKEKLSRAVIVVKGGPCTGKTTLARALAKSLGIGCTLASQDDFLSCTSRTERLLSTCPSIEALTADHLRGLSDQVLWKVVQTQLQVDQNVIIDSSLHTSAHLDRFLALSSSSEKYIHIGPIIIECQAQNKSEWRSRLSKTYGPEETERILEGDGHEYDTGDIPKLSIDTTSGLEIEQHVRKMEHFIRIRLDKKRYGEMSTGKWASYCKDCKMDYVEKVTAHLPSTLKHQCHEHELALNNYARGYAFDKRFTYLCNACGFYGINVHYFCTAGSCGFLLHAKCALNLPLTIMAPFHHWHPPLVLASRPMDPELCYCDLCEEKRSPENWIYSCQECEYSVHIKCASPKFCRSIDMIQYIDQ